MLCDINLQNKVRLQNKVPPAELTIALSAVVLRIAPVADANDDVKGHDAYIRAVSRVQHGRFVQHGGVVRA